MDRVIGNQRPAAARARVRQRALARAGISTQQSSHLRAADAGGMQRSEEDGVEGRQGESLEEIMAKEGRTQRIVGDADRPAAGSLVEFGEVHFVRTKP